MLPMYNMQAEWMSLLWESLMQRTAGAPQRLQSTRVLASFS